jgi:hypothetical protein
MRHFGFRSEFKLRNAVCLLPTAKRSGKHAKARTLNEEAERLNTHTCLLIYSNMLKFLE